MSRTTNILLTLKQIIPSWFPTTPTLHITDVPYVLREPAVLSGYRQLNQPWRYYFASFFQLHNESVNVWTHSLATIILGTVLYNCISEYGVNGNYLGPVVVFLLNVIGSCIISSFVHLLHSKSIEIHYTTCMIDYIAVNMYIFATAIINLYSLSEKTLYFILEPYYMSFLIFATWLNLVISCSAKIIYGDRQNIKRKVIHLGSNVFVSVSFSTPVVYRLWKCFCSPECSMESVNHVTACVILIIMQAFFFGSHLPERLAPGKCDIVGQGHQIFHILSTITQVLQVRAAREDHTTGASAHTNPNFEQLLQGTLVMILLNLATLFFIWILIKWCSNRKNE